MNKINKHSKKKMRRYIIEEEIDLLRSHAKNDVLPWSMSKYNDQLYDDANIGLHINFK